MPRLAVPAESEVTRVGKASLWVPGSAPAVGWALAVDLQGLSVKEESTVLSAAGHPQAQKELGRRGKADVRRM